MGPVVVAQHVCHHLTRPLYPPPIRYYHAYTDP